MPANLKNSAVAAGLEKVSFHSNPKERQWQRMFNGTTALISHASKVMLKIPQARLQQYVNREQKMKIMASGPITSQQIGGETMETVTDFIFLGSKITADIDGSHKIKRCLLLGRKSMTNPDSILKNRDITLPTDSI